MFTGSSPQVAVPSGGVCPAGYVCPRGTKFPQQHPCPMGTWSNVVGAQNVSLCRRCPPGHYCNSTGLSRPSGVCDTGTERPRPAPTPFHPRCGLDSVTRLVQHMSCLFERSDSRVLLLRGGGVPQALWWSDGGRLSSRTLLSHGLSVPDALP